LDLGIVLFVARVSLFSLDIKVKGFCTTDSSGRKTYTKGRVIKLDVEVASFSLDLLLTSLSNEVQWSSRQCPSVWFFNKRLCEEANVENDFQLHEMFEMYKEHMQCPVVVEIVDKSLREADEFAWLDPICAIPPDCYDDDNRDKDPNSKDIPPRNRDSTSLDGNHATQLDVEPELEPDREPDLFDNEEEYVGVDDEGLYMSVESAQATNNPSTFANDDNLDNDADQFDGVAAAEGGDPLEAEVNDADPAEVQVIHDPENPKIKKGQQFPDIVSFRKAIRHVAVVTGFELANIITDKTRFIAHCKAEGCPWRIHASRIFDGKTIEVLLSYHIYLNYLHVVSGNKFYFIFFVLCV
jgi:hypothetical protein